MVTRSEPPRWLALTLEVAAGLLLLLTGLPALLMRGAKGRTAGAPAAAEPAPADPLMGKLRTSGFSSLTPGEREALRRRTPRP